MISYTNEQALDVAQAANGNISAYAHLYFNHYDVRKIIKKLELNKGTKLAAYVDKYDDNVDVGDNVASHHTAAKYIQKALNLDLYYGDAILDTVPAELETVADHKAIHAAMRAAGLTEDADRLLTQLNTANKGKSIGYINREILIMLQDAYDQKGEAKQGQLAVKVMEDLMHNDNIDLDPPPSP